jgi:hypothetical protein
MHNSTLVTGIWDLGRASLSEGWGRSFQHYIDNFKSLLESTKDYPLIVFIEPENEHIVWEIRSKENTSVHHVKISDFNSSFFPFFDQVQKIRTDPAWYNQVSWLKDSTQGQMEWYNPMVMSKMFMLHNAKCFNPFNTEYLFWIDGGITNTVHPGYFSHDKVIDKIESITSKFLFVCFPYSTTTEIHGFSIKKMEELAHVDSIDYVARGGFFGGHIEYISKANELYYSLLDETLKQGYMGTEESIFTLMTYLDPDTYDKHMINDDGLISTFFENIKNNKVINPQLENNTQRKQYTNNNIILYINAFNSPEQLQMVLNSFEKHDTNFLTKTRKILLNNTTKEELFPKYDEIVKKYNFEEIRHGNKGICRSRQIAAEHFAQSESKYMMFFEDDMLLDFDGNCPFGFKKTVNNLFNTLIKIMDNEHYDFLKFSFSEFFGHNGDQWSWHNVPSENRLKYFGRTNKKPPTNFTHIKTYNGTPYAEGEVYYCNWPHIIDQEGNQKLFLDTKWDNPFEQTWMSHIYTLSKEKQINSAILLCSPITHNRVHFYEASERKEN